MATKKAAPKFSNKHIEIIAGSLSRPKDKRKQELLPQILREWCDVDLQRHWSIEGREAIRERMRKIEKVRKRASDLLRALEEVDDPGRRRIVTLIVLGGREFNLADYVDHALYAREQAEREELTKQLGETREFLVRLAAIEPKAPEFGRGHPRNILAYLVLQDSAAIFEWYTGTKATRGVHRVTRKETGPFWRFASALWPIFFGRDTQGLPAAIKNWQIGRKRFGEQSPLIANIRFRHRTWGI